MFTKTVEPRTLEILKSLMHSDLLKDYRLVGGTALALQFGHRVSIDLDLFGNVPLDNHSLRSFLESLGELEIIHFSSQNAINSCLIDNVKLDFVKYHYPWLDDSILDEGVRMATTKDIAAMKISAIGGRGAKKDFFDLYFLLETYSIYEIFKFFQKKYQISNLLHYVKSLGYFESAERDLDPVMLQKLSWNQVKKRIIKEIKNLDFEKLAKIEKEFKKKLV